MLSECPFCGDVVAETWLVPHVRDCDEAPRRVRAAAGSDV